jgi:hypothetical protein
MEPPGRVPHPGGPPGAAIGPEEHRVPQHLQAVGLHLAEVGLVAIGGALARLEGSDDHGLVAGLELAQDPDIDETGLLLPRLIAGVDETVLGVRAAVVDAGGEIGAQRARQAGGRDQAPPPPGP